MHHASCFAGAVGGSFLLQTVSFATHWKAFYMLIEMIPLITCAGASAIAENGVKYLSRRFPVRIL
jgi:hypothetical protein